MNNQKKDCFKIIMILKPLLLSIALSIFIKPVFGQAPPIDLQSIHEWTSLNPIDLSADGNYMCLGINKGNTCQKIVFQAINKDWKLEIENCIGPSFISNSKYAVFKTSNDSLGILKLSSGVTYISDVVSFEVPKLGNTAWIVYKLNSNDLILYNVITKEKKIFKDVKNYLINDNWSRLLINSSKHNGKAKSNLSLFDFKTNKISEICTGCDVENLLFDRRGNNVAFVTDDSLKTEIIKTIWYFNSKLKKANILADGNSLNQIDKFRIEHIDFFSSDGNHLFFTLSKEKLVNELLANQIGLNVWSYMDPKIQSKQLNEKKFSNNLLFACSYNLNTNKIIRIDDGILLNHKKSIKYALLLRNENGDSGNEWNWNAKSLYDVDLICLKDGSKKIINTNVPERSAFGYQLSPDEKYVIFFDPKNHNWFSYDVKTEVKRNITKGIVAFWTSYDRKDEKDSDYLDNGIAGWIKGQSKVMIYDRYDVYQIDISGESEPICITNHFGVKNNTIFRLALRNTESIFDHNEKLILSAFNQTNKYDGYYSFTVGAKRSFSKIISEPFLYNGPDQSANVSVFYPLKARDRNVYIVRKMCSTSADYYSITKDFRTFVSISDFHPERGYNWLTSELINYKLPNGEVNQGILYKPENFDVKKKYPIIFYYYEKISESLYKFLEPDVSDGPMNIPYFVSNGYLVFTPDIYKQVGHPGESALVAVNSAANYLSKLNFVDSNKMGLQGHSFGGFETNYIITHTHRFAAAMSASGMSDFISCYGSIMTLGDGSSRQRQYEIYHDGIGASLAERPDLYIENSPVFQSNNITTPLLMMNNISDGDVPFAQGLEFYTALRRLGKKAWMLQYDGGNHTIGGIQAIDFTIRMQQFFDHYLKGAPAPKWMVEGIPASMKGIDDGLALEPPGVEPGPNLLTPEEQRKVDSLQKRKPITITIH